MDCASARMFLELGGREGKELLPADQHLLDGHLGGCPECSRLVRAERKSDRVLGRAMNAILVPPSLKVRILENLPRPTPRGVWRRNWPWIAASLALLLAGGGTAYWFLKSGAKVEYDQMVKQITDLDQAISWNAEEVDKWFSAKGLTTKAPRNFNYALLESIAVREEQGHRIPYLLFRVEGNASRLAHVLIFPAGLADAKFQPDMRNPLSNHIIEVFTEPKNGRPEFYYLVVYTTGSDLKAFQLQVPAIPL